MNTKKLFGILLTLFGACLAVLATFIPQLNFLLDQPFNWFISLSLLCILGGLALHIILNKKLPLDDEEEDETANNQILTSNTKPLAQKIISEDTTVKANIEDTVVK